MVRADPQEVSKPSESPAPAVQQSRALVCHAWNVPAHVRGVDVCAIRHSDGGLNLTYMLAGGLERLRLPERSGRFSRDPLWQHTCFEVFLAREGEASYQEFNFAPSGAWGAYAFRERRERVAWTSPLAPPISVQIRHEQLTLKAELPLAVLSPQLRDGTLRLGLSAVIEGGDGSLSYWALRHGRGQPDFHDPECFTLTFDARPLHFQQPERGTAP